MCYDSESSVTVLWECGSPPQRQDSFSITDFRENSEVVISLHKVAATQTRFVKFCFMPNIFKVLCHYPFSLTSIGRESPCFSSARIVLPTLCGHGVFSTPRNPSAPAGGPPANAGLTPSSLDGVSLTGGGRGPQHCPPTHMPVTSLELSPVPLTDHLYIRVPFLGFSDLLECLTECRETRLLVC